MVKNYFAVLGFDIQEADIQDVKDILKQKRRDRKYKQHTDQY